MGVDEKVVARVFPGASRTKRFMVLSALVFVILPYSSGHLRAQSLKLTYERPARFWHEALPVGNGRLGAMVFGGVDTERIQLNEDSIWAGRLEDRDRPEARQGIDRARRLIFEDNYQEADRVVKREVLGPRWIRSYQTLGDLTLEMPSEGVPAEYRRELDLDSAVSAVRYRLGSSVITREVFSSFPDQVIVVRIRSSQPGRIDLNASLSRSENATMAMMGPGRIALRGQALNDPRHGGVFFEGQVLAQATGGRISTDAQGIHIREADEVVLLVAAATNYRGRDPGRECERVLQAASAKSFESLRESHIADHQRLFRRVSLDLGDDGKGELSTDKRIRNVASGEIDRGLEALYFQYGRYLLIASSRPGGLPSNLQGIWCQDTAAAWNSDYHININIQMIYWPAEVTNLSECHGPFFDLIDRIRERGSRTARVVYKAGGFVAHHTTDAWWFTSPIGEPQWGMFPSGGAWTTQHLMEHYRYSDDEDFLRSRAWPALKGAAEFYLDWLVEHPVTGRLVSGPSSSPEHTFISSNGQRANLSMAPSMDQQICWDVFTNVLEAAKDLRIESPFVQRVSEARDRLQGTGIGKDGRLMEWAEPFADGEKGHRHISHLFGLHPGRQFSIRKTPAAAAAARRSLEYRLQHGGGHTGWSRAWLVNFWARLHEGDRAHADLRKLIGQSTAPNLFDTHPISGDQFPQGYIFQMDGNGGGTAGMAEMLVQSHAGEIDLLPALPTAWKAGRVTGLRVRGNITFDMEWRDNRATRVILRPGTTREIRVRPPARQRISSIEDAKGSSVSGRGEGTSRVFPATAGETYTISFEDDGKD